MQLQFLGNRYQPSAPEIETTESPIQGTYRGATVAFRTAQNVTTTQPRGLKFRGTTY